MNTYKIDAIRHTKSSVNCEINQKTDKMIDSLIKSNDLLKDVQALTIRHKELRNSLKESNQMYLADSLVFVMTQERQALYNTLASSPANLLKNQYLAQMVQSYERLYRYLTNVTETSKDDLMKDIDSGIRYTIQNGKRKRVNGQYDHSRISYYAYRADKGCNKDLLKLFSKAFQTMYRFLAENKLANERFLRSNMLETTFKF